MSTNRYYNQGFRTAVGKQVEYIRYTKKDRNWNNGLGIGYELFRGPGSFNPFGLNLMIGYAAYKNFTEANFTGEIALVYKFGKVKSIK